MADLFWSDAVPKTDGYYWFRWDHDFAPAVVKVYADQVRFCGQWGPITNLSGEWAGPLVPPGEGESETP